MNKDMKVAVTLFVIALVLIVALFSINQPPQVTYAQGESATPTFTPPPVCQCSNLHVEQTYRLGSPPNKLVAQIHNTNSVSCPFHWTEVVWPDYDYDIAYLHFEAFGQSVFARYFWMGYADESPTIAEANPVIDHPGNSIWYWVIDFDSVHGMGAYSIDGTLRYDGPCVLEMNWPSDW